MPEHFSIADIDTPNAVKFSAPDIDQPKPSFGSRMVEGSTLLSTLANPGQALEQLSGIGPLKGIVTSLQKGDKQGAALQLLQMGPRLVNPGAGAAIDTATGLGTRSKDQFQKAFEAYKQGDYNSAIGHAAAVVVPFFAPSADAGDLIGKGDFKGGAGLIAGQAVDLLAPKAIGKGAEVYQKPGVSKMVQGGAGLAAGGGVALAGHPIIGSELAAAGAARIAQGIAERKAALTPPALPSGPSAPEVSLVEGLRKLGQPDNHFAPIPEQAAPPTAAVPSQVPSMPVRVAPVAVQPKVEQFTPPAPENRAAIPGATQGLIDMLERRRGLSESDAALLQKLKAQASPAGSPGDTAARAGSPPMPASPAVETIPGRESPPAEFFQNKARAARSDNVEVLANHLSNAGIAAEDVGGIKNADLRDLAKASGIDLPKDLGKTLEALKQRVFELQKAKNATAIVSDEYKARLASNPRALAASEALAAAMAGKE